MSRARPSTTVEPWVPDPKAVVKPRRGPSGRLPPHDLGAWMTDYDVGTAMRTLTDAVKRRSAERAKDRLPEFLAAERDVLRAHEELLRLGVDVPLLGKHVVDAADLSSLHVTNVTSWGRDVLHPRPAAVPEAPEPPVAAEPCETCGGNGFLVCKPCNGGGVGSGGDECSDCRGAGGKPCPDCAPPGADAK